MDTHNNFDLEVALPNPVFEGSEKRLEVEFAQTGRAPGAGLRAIAREQLDELMTLAHCCIVSSRSNAHFDAYVLSESSLFVYADKWILKTCGTTRLLQSVPRLLEIAAVIGMQPCRVKFSRATFQFPDQQVGARQPIPLSSPFFYTLHAPGRHLQPVQLYHPHCSISLTHPSMTRSSFWTSSFQRSSGLLARPTSWATPTRAFR